MSAPSDAREALAGYDWPFFIALPVICIAAAIIMGRSLVPKRAWVRGYMGRCLSARAARLTQRKASFEMRMRNIDGLQLRGVQIGSGKA